MAVLSDSYELSCRTCSHYKLGQNIEKLGGPCPSLSVDVDVMITSILDVVQGKTPSSVISPLPRQRSGEASSCPSYAAILQGPN